MLELSIYKVTVRIEQGSRWERYFAGRPDDAEVIAVLEADCRAETERAKNETCEQLVAAKYEYFTTLVRDNGLPEGELTVCTYAGVTIGEIRVEEKPPALTTEVMS